MALINAKLALLATHFLGVASYGYSSLQASNAGDDDLGGKLQSVPSKGLWTKLDSSFKSGLVIGYVFSSVSIFTIFLFYCVPWARLNKRKRNKMTMKTPLMASLMERREKKIKEANEQISTFQMSIPRISFAELKKATTSFDRDRVIGVGTTGTVYKAAHPHLLFTAVKRLLDFQHLEEQFLSELMILDKYRHKNIVPLLGFCLESRERLLVYQYMPNGNLHDWLHPVKGEPEILEWHLRVNIAVGIARGLAWLHNHNTLQLVHLNLSSSCILLDKYFEPKISNFGRAMHMITTSNAGIFMADSEMDGWDLIKEDVHQLGVLLLELITGEDPSSNSEFYQSLERKFVQNDCPSTVSAALYCSVDKSLLGQGFDREVLYFLKVACSCVHPLPNRRPTMVEVHKMLMAIHVPTFWAKTNISMNLAAP
ncbi:inactive leucine-rich repeat receptor protein [Salix suchowensis]|nr:inactive leucine-rich repeat receptor protein [Salix suchowensis]